MLQENAAEETETTTSILSQAGNEDASLKAIEAARESLFDDDEMLQHAKDESMGPVKKHLTHKKHHQAASHNKHKLHQKHASTHAITHLKGHKKTAKHQHHAQVPKITQKKDKCAEALDEPDKPEKEDSPIEATKKRQNPEPTGPAADKCAVSK